MKSGTPGFVGARLRHGREARGITASALADIVGVSRAAVSQYEDDGPSSPSPESLRKLCAALNLPALWFLRPKVRRDGGTIYFRCLSVATKGARLRAERRYDWLRDVVAFLCKRVAFPAVTFPDLRLPADPAAIDITQVEESATAVRRFWGMNDGPIGNMAWLLENNGAVVSRFDLHAATLDAFSEWEPNENRPYVILGSQKGSACRSRFDAAHELAHLVLHRAVPKSAYAIKEAFSLMEEQANRFAAAFLLPEESFGNEFIAPSLDALLSLKRRWRVSIAAIIIRLSRIGLIGEEQERRLWVNLSRRKWRTVEPLDDVIPPEQPQFLRRCIELLISKGRMHPSELRIDTGLPASDIEQLVGLVPGYLEQIDAEFQQDPEADVRPNIIQFART